VDAGDREQKYAWYDAVTILPDGARPGATSGSLRRVRAALFERCQREMKEPGI
jgi:hypothetical protein